MIFVLIFAFLFAFGVGFSTGRDSNQDERFIEKHKEKTICLQEQATVMDRTITLKRCWKLQEVNPESSPG